MVPETKSELFFIPIPTANGKGVIRTVPVQITVEFDGEDWILTEESQKIIEDRQAAEIGLLSAEELYSLRKRLGYTQAQMGEIFQIGEKSWTRWETGKHRPSRSINLLIRALYDGQLEVGYLLHRAEMPSPQSDIISYFKTTFQNSSQGNWEAKKVTSLSDFIMTFATATSKIEKVDCRPSVCSNLPFISSGRFGAPVIPNVEFLSAS